jgi:hypothetical protein
MGTVRPVRKCIAKIVDGAFVRSGRSLELYRHSSFVQPNGNAFVRFVEANYPTGSSPPKVVLALHGTQEMNTVSICRDGLRPSTSGTCGLGA